MPETPRQRLYFFIKETIQFMTMESLSLQAEPRSVTGKKVKGLRRLGLTPIHVYGRGTEPTALQADAVTLRKIVAQAGSNVPVTVNEERGSHFAFIREVQRHPLTEDILHVDFLEVPLTETIRSEVPVYLIGEAPAVRLMDGALNQALYSLQVESLPLDVPQFVEVDVSSLEDFERGIHVSDLNLGDKVTVLNDPEELVARVNAPAAVVEEVEAPAEVELVGGEPAAESEDDSG